MGIDITVSLGWVDSVISVSTDEPTTRYGRLFAAQIPIRISPCVGSAAPRRNYDLFSWLAGIPEGVRPIHSDAATVLKDHMAALQGVKEISNRTTHTDGDGVQIFAVGELDSFDYDQVAEVLDPDGPIFEDTYIPHPEGLTYRQLFAKEKGNAQSSNWFEFLDYCREKGVGFIIVSF